MAANTLPAQAVLLQLLRYDPETGALTRLSNGKRADRAMTIGYRSASVEGVVFYAHRVIWQMLHGCVPEQIDHVNGDRADNRACNLRAVTKAENALNKRPSRRNSSGVTGVCWVTRLGKWKAEIQASGVKKHIGVFDTLEDAAAARKQAEARLGFHKNHGL